MWLDVVVAKAIGHTIEMSTPRPVVAQLLRTVAAMCCGQPTRGERRARSGRMNAMGRKMVSARSTAFLAMKYATGDMPAAASRQNIVRS